MNSSTSRRDFLRASAALTTALATADARAADAPLYAGDIVDTHQHLWNLQELRLPWVNNLTGKAKEALHRDYLLTDYAEATRGLRVTKAVYMEVDVAEEDEVKEADFITKVCASGKGPTVAAVISGRPASPGFKDYLDRFKGNKTIKGLRQVLHSGATPPKFCLEEPFVRGIQLLGERGLSFDLCFRNDQLDYGAELIDRCPETRFILDHLGNPHAGKNDLKGWEKGIAKIADAKNRKVMCKVSGVYGNVSAADWPAEKLAPIVRTVIDRFGWDRVLFAGDWPVVNVGASFAVWTETVKRIVRADSAADQRKLFYENAVRFYGLA